MLLKVTNFKLFVIVRSDDKTLKDTVNPKYSEKEVAFNQLSRKGKWIIGRMPF